MMYLGEAGHIQAKQARINTPAVIKAADADVFKRDAIFSTASDQAGSKIHPTRRLRRTAFLRRAPHRRDRAHFKSCLDSTDQLEP